jgi:glycosyltransferase involved in cell wall biosynthesis
MPALRADATPVRVLHLIDSLAGGGSEQLLWDQVRLSPGDIEQKVLTVFPDHGGSGYAQRLRSRGAYPQPPAGALFEGLRRGAARRPGAPPWRRLYSVFFYTASFVWSTFWLRRVLRSFRPAVIHAHTFFAFPLALIGARRGIALVHSVPCLVAQMKDAGAGWLARAYARYHRRVERFVTGASLEELRRLGVPAAKIYWQAGVIDVAAVDRARADRDGHRRRIRERLGLGAESLIALSVGRLHASKGHRFALEALPGLLPQIPALHWVVLGAGPEGVQLAERAAALAVTPHVHLVGFEEDPLPFYAAADVYLRTATLEADNLSSYQALATGLPVVGFDTGAETELLHKVGHGLLVPNRDSAALGAALANLLQLPDRGRGRGALGIAYAPRIDLSTTIAALAELYRELDRSGQRSPRP